MANVVFIYSGAILTLIWGVAHLIPTKSVVKNFGDISIDNQRILTMEWISEGVLMIFIGCICAAVTYLDLLNKTSVFIYLASAVTLITMAVISFFTGFQVNFLPYKLCPFIFTLSAILLLLGTNI